MAPKLEEPEKVKNILSEIGEISKLGPRLFFEGGRISI